MKELILAIESSCDDTCAAVIKAQGEGLKVLSNVVSSQIDIHKLYGGVVPEIASRNHVMSIQTVVEEALTRANVGLHEINRIAATTHPGLRGAVMVGHVFGDSLSTALNIPFIEVNHLAAHIASVRLNFDIKPPFLALLVSGGHTSLYKINAWQDIALLCETSDDACGEAFDKVAKLLGLGYPGGVQIQELSKQFKGKKEDLITFVKQSSKTKSFSYSGLKTAVLNYVNTKKQRGEALDLPLIAASFQCEAVEQLVSKCMSAIKEHGIKTLSVCGGVSANLHLRERMRIECERLGAKVFVPDFEFCTDNAAMVGAAAALGVEM